jgi:hypothetical protein
MRTSDCRQYTRGQGSFDKVAMHFIENCVDTLPYSFTLRNCSCHTAFTQSSMRIYFTYRNQKTLSLRPAAAEGEGPTLRIVSAVSIFTTYFVQCPILSHTFPSRNSDSATRWKTEESTSFEQNCYFVQIIFPQTQTQTHTHTHTHTLVLSRPPIRWVLEIFARG